MTPASSPSCAWPRTSPTPGPWTCTGRARLESRSPRWPSPPTRSGLPRRASAASAPPVA
ncbi:hypothetical protein lerEdw1_011266 [Lerista edwardsae]|nr:hypothetical protein lerEdw1_011266 [Lerista edwardsae]